MDFNFKKTGNMIIIYLKGRVDVHQCAEIEQEIGKLISFESTSHLLFNMTDVEYISSSGLRIIVSTMKILKDDNRKMAICNLNNAVKKIFEVVQITDMFNIFDSEEDAVVFLKKA
jgi:anti-anti-sigma factor